MASLSVVLCNYNHARYLNDTIRAILTQSRVPDELIIVDDASSDESREIISSFHRSHAGIRTVFNEKNLGVVPSANRGLEISSGDYVYFAAADDRVLPSFFEKAMAAAEANPQAGCVISDPVFFDEDGSSWIHPLPLGGQPRVLTREDVIAAQKAKAFLVPGHASIVRRAVAVKAGGLLPALKWYCDWYMNHVISLRDGLVYLPLPLAAMRLSPNSYSGRNSLSWSVQREVLKSLTDLLLSPAYADVAQPFAEAGLLIQLGPGVGRYLREDRRMADFLSPAARRRLLINTLRQKMSQVLPLSLKRKLKKLLSLDPPSYIMP